MDIREAKVQLTHAVRAYLAKDGQGLPLTRKDQQRPIILIGPPGIGKTAIVSQVARELGINLVSYSMTHHTRQSALGLPYIADETYGDRTYRVSRYTMSEIIGSVHDAMAETRKDEGILFLDEVNCVSETLMPSMLQFLQFKRFGQHELPAGWVVVCAANPADYNRSATELDAATLDRLRRIDVEPDLDAWLDYASVRGVHPAVTSYLTSAPDHFFVAESTLDGLRMVTARGWDDLSATISAYRALDIPCDEGLISQYLPIVDVARSFASYLGLYLAHEDDYRVRDILAGTVADEVVDRAAKAPFDERMAVVELIVRPLVAEAEEALAHEGQLREERSRLTGHGVTDRQRADFCRRVDAAEDEAKQVLGHTDAALDFMCRAFGEGDEMMVALSRMAQSKALMHLAAAYGCAGIRRYADLALVSERGRTIIEQL